MNNKFLQLIYTWPKPYIHDQDMLCAFGQDNSKRDDAIKYAVKKGLLIRIKRGLYIIQLPYKKINYNPFEVAYHIYGPSYVSFESALSYHCWIPEKVVSFTLACVKKSKKFDNFIGNFIYSHVPVESFMMQVIRKDENKDENKEVYLIASPWKAIADHIYAHDRAWKSVRDMMEDMRIERYSIEEEPLSNLLELADNYHSVKVRKLLMKFYKEINNEH